MTPPTAVPAARTPQTANPQRSTSRREEILAVAVDLFANRGYHGVSMDDIGAAAGVTGPALYHHFAGKEAMLSAGILPGSQQLLVDARRLRDNQSDPATLAAALVEFHAAFAVANPALITLNTHELDRLPETCRDALLAIQRQYLAIWTEALQRLNGWPSTTARAAALATLGLMNATPLLDTTGRDTLRTLLRDMALAALNVTHPATERPPTCSTLS